MSTDISWLKLLDIISYEPSALELSKNFILFFVMFCIGAYIAYKIINRRKNYINMIGLQYSSIALVSMLFVSLFIIVSISYTVPTQNDPTFSHRHYIEILVFGVLFLTFLTGWIYKRFEKNHTTICLYGINPNHKIELIKKAVAQLGWIDYEINKEYKRNLAYSRYSYANNMREEIVITSSKKNIYIRGNSILYAKLVSNDLENNYIEGTELDSFKETFIEVIVSSHTYTTRAWVAFWFFIVGAASSLYIIVNYTFLNLDILFFLMLPMSSILTIGLLFLFVDSFNIPSSKVKRW